MPSQRAPLVVWTREEAEKLIGWMEDNQQHLRGKQMAWYKLVKEEVFAGDDYMHITVKKIADKVFNIKRSWKEAKAMQEQSGWGAKPEENETSINEVLERKCPFFWRLEEVWGTRPNATMIVNTESSTAPPSTPSQPTLQAPLPIRLQSTVLEEEQLEWTPTPPLQSPPPQSPPPQSPSPELLPPQSPPPESSLQSRIGTPTARSGKRDLGMLLKETLDARHSRKIEVSLKRHKAEMELKKEELEIKRETIAANERIAQIQADMLSKQADAQAKQADAQARQAESFTRLMERMLATIEGQGKCGESSTLE